MATLVIALSFGKRRKDQEPNPSNFQLGRELEEVIDNTTGMLSIGKLLVVAQWEIARQLEQDGYGSSIDLVVTQNSATYKGKKRYLDNQDVIDKALDWASTLTDKVTDVIIVANPFLHLSACKKLVEARGLKTIDYPIGKIPFDNAPPQLQWWCKGPIRFILYGVIVKGGEVFRLNLHGIGEHSE